MLHCTRSLLGVAMGLPVECVDFHDISFALILIVRAFLLRFIAACAEETLADLFEYIILEFHSKWHFHDAPLACGTLDDLA